MRLLWLAAALCIPVTEPRAYFLVRWRPPYHFSMMDIFAKPWPACNEEDREADEWRALFSTQEWRR